MENPQETESIDTAIAEATEGLSLTPAKGGDVIFSAGAGYSPDPDVKPIDGSFRFKLADGTEVMRIDPDGAFTVRGERTTYPADIHGAMSQFLEQCGVYSDDAD